MKFYATFFVGSIIGLCLTSTYAENKEPTLDESVMYVNTWVEKIGVLPTSNNCEECKSHFFINSDGTLVFETVTPTFRASQKLPIQMLMDDGVSFVSDSTGSTIEYKCENSEKCVELEYVDKKTGEARVSVDRSLTINLMANKKYNPRVFKAAKHIVWMLRKELRGNVDPFAGK